MEEKRKGRRVRANAIVSFKVKAGHLTGGSRIKDISETGICIPSKHHFPVDSLLEVEIRSEALKDPLKLMAKVVRVINRRSSKFQFEVGLVFLEVPLIYKGRLNDFIQQAIAQGDQDISWLDL